MFFENIIKNVRLFFIFIKKIYKNAIDFHLSFKKLKNSYILFKSILSLDNILHKSIEL